MPLKVYASRPPDGSAHVGFLAPFWGSPMQDSASLHCGLYDDWAHSGAGHYALVADPAEADFAVLSVSWKDVGMRPSLEAFAAGEIVKCKQMGRQIFVFGDSDDDRPEAWPEHVIALRYTLYDDTAHPQERAAPIFCKDLRAELPGQKLVPRPKGETPTVSFCGFSPPVGCRLNRASGRHLLRYLAYRAGLLRNRRSKLAHVVRTRSIRELQKARGVRTAFIIRDQFAFNATGALQPGGTPGSAKEQRAEFIDTIIHSDYALCARGLANASIRFGEALSLGRIPLFVNTDCVLPFEETVDWRRLTLWVEEADLGRIGEIVAEFHRKLDPEEFAAMQLACRQAFERWICPAGFFAALPRYLDNQSRAYAN